MATRKLGALLFPVAILLQLCLCQITPEILPEFLAPLENHTVIQGREVTFTCIVNHLNSYRVAWIKSDSRAILAIHTHLVTHNNRLSVTHNGHNTWKLTVSNVQKNDSGTYMCQVNTDPMLSQIGSITVVVPPDIIDEASSESPMAHEGGNINLRCVATGTPEPNVTWKREDGKNIILRENGLRKSVPKYDNETLELSGVLRTEMGAYLCIASNGIPPSISKRYSVLVQFSPSIKVTNNVVAAPVNKHVALQCIVEASPQAMNTWHTNGEKLLPSEKYVMTEKQINEYTWAMNLTIRMLKKTDFRSYMCSSDNALGKAEGSVSLQELELFPTTTPGTQSRPNDLRPGKKKPNNKSDNRSRNKNEQHHRNNENSENFYSHNNQDNDLSHGGSSNSLSGHTTQTMNGGGQARGQHHTERPHFYPPVSPDWTSVNEANQRFSKQVWVIMTIGLYAIFARRYCV